MADLLSTDYASFLSDLKSRIRTAQTKAVLSVNRELIALYFDMGKAFVAQQEQAQWGDAMFEQLSKDLMREFPGQSGFSRRNLYRMRAFYLAYKNDGEFVPQAVAQIPWGHNILLLEKEFLHSALFQRHWMCK